MPTKGVSTLKVEIMFELVNMTGVSEMYMNHLPNHNFSKELFSSTFSIL